MNKLFRQKKAVLESDIPKRTLIILSNPRSGSTWLLDALRCHPSVEMLVSGDIYRVLGLEGRRYPRDLVPNNRKHIQMEVRPGLDKWAEVPLFSIPQDEYNIPREISQKRYAIEKIHPHYYGFDKDLFISSINEYNKDKNLEMIYLVRDPKASLVSFLNYQKRNPKWNAGKKQQDVIEHMSLIYQNILGVAKQWEGQIIDYGQLRENFEKTLSRVLESLWPGTDHLDPDRIQLINRLKSETAWEKRKSKRPFLGNQVGSITGENSDYDQFFEKNIDAINQCKLYYEALLNLDDK